MKYFFLSLLLLIYPQISQAVGTAVSPASLELVYPDRATGILTVRNISTEPVVVDAYVDDFTKDISVSPANFELLPNEVIAVEINANLIAQPLGVRKTDVSIVSRARDQASFNAATGLKIPLTVNIVTTSRQQWLNPWLLFTTIFSLILLFTLWQLLRYWSRPRRHRFSLHINLKKHHRHHRWPWLA